MSVKDTGGEVSGTHVTFSRISEFMKIACSGFYIAGSLESPQAMAQFPLGKNMERDPDPHLWCF
jgi:hypothetical protein